MRGDGQLEFVDSNVLIYAYDTSTGRRHAQARELVRSLWLSGRGCISIQVLQEFYVNASRKVRAPLPDVTAAQVVVDMTGWPIHRPTPEDVVSAVVMHQRYQISFWDAMLLTSALRMGCHTVWSEDLNAGQSYDGVIVANPFLT